MKGIDPFPMGPADAMEELARINKRTRQTIWWTGFVWGAAVVSAGVLLGLVIHIAATS